ncbi:TPA: hypothetical protein ACXDAY_002225 [Clostridium botulinum]|uniref:hypothetical protein n=1 Tax=Clostridium botulinum TaxID=1491 RepID=UPI000464A84F|nr:hypothetical protein [Clostridium botulinum]APH20872.1 hypothetical protein NPD1_4145 [Clostridium botulinum]APQ71138.1 hypothetical protein RSJ8_4102 [Clostridium botulinum]APR02306.1 hypothetical protein RSJ2_3958 [Clostridium botulinum]AUN01482.1 hypothetical protein RSJ19_00425 [Clostridium botulinum]MBN3359210.1 hypothetical protein [Clostridium botulinum]
MNTEETINKKFVERNEYPIWYYKELESVDVDYVIWNLLKKKFVVETEGSKHEILFGKNKDDEIGQYIRYDEIKNSNLTSYKVVERGFREGKWFIITDKNTSDEFKADYNKRKAEFKKEESKEFYRHILKNAIRSMKELSEEDRDKHMQFLDNTSYEELEKLFDTLMKNTK